MSRPLAQAWRCETCERSTGKCLAVPGACRADNKCYANGEAKSDAVINANDACVRCLPWIDTRKLSVASGFSCDDRDLCTFGDRCSDRGICKGEEADCLIKYRTGRSDLDCEMCNRSPDKCVSPRDLPERLRGRSRPGPC